MQRPRHAECGSKAVDLGLLEEDDEFEEFPAESKSSKNNLSPLGTLFLPV